MPGQNIIEIGFDIEKLSAGKKVVLEEFADLFDKLGKYDGTRFDPLGKGGLTELRKSVKDGAAAMGDYQSATDKYIKTVTEQVNKQKEARKATDDLGASQKENTAVFDAYATSQDRLRRQSAENKVAQEQLSQTIRSLRDYFNDGNISVEEYTKRLEPLLAQQLSLKVANTDVTKTLTVLEKQFQSTAGSTVQLEGRLKELQGVYDNLSPEGRSAEPGKALLQEIKDVDAAFKALKGDTGRFQDNVGNYSGAFLKAFQVLQEQLVAVKGEMGDLEAKGKTVVNNLTGGNPIGFNANRHKGDVTSFTGAGGSAVNIAAGDAAAYQASAQKAQLLESTVERLGIGFKTTRQESRAFQEAAVGLGLALGQTDDKFLLFNEAVGEVQNGINDIKAATKFQAQDAKFIVGLTSAVNGLVGAYGAASAAVSILGGDEEEAQKSMAKFQQLLVLINGLQQVANVLQEESGAFQLALAAKTALAAAATKINTIITTEAIAAIHAQVEANAALAGSQEAVVLTTEEAAAAISETVATNTEATASAIGLSLAEDAVAESAVVATGAVTGFGAALVASGVGVIVVAVGVAVAFLIIKVREWMAATQLNTNQQKELNDALAAQIDALQKINDLQDVAGKKSLAALQHQLDLEEKSGQSNYAILALKQKIADKNAEIADSKYTQALAKAEDLYVKEGLTGIEALHRAQGDYFEDLTAKTYDVATVQKELDNVTGLTDREKKQQDISDKDIQRIKDRLAKAQSAQALAQKDFDFYTKGEEDRTKSHNEQENLRTEHSKLTTDEQRKVLEEGIKQEADARKFANAEILNNDNSTLSQRLAAVKSNGEQEVKILQAQTASILSDPANRISKNGPLTDAAKSQLTQLAQQQKQALLSSQDEQTKIKRSYYERDRDANLAAYKTQLEDQIKAAQELQQGKGNNPNPLAPRPKVDLSDRLKGLSDEYSARRDILNAELKEELDKEGQTAQEKKTIYAKYGSDIAQLGKDFQKTYVDLEKEAQEESIREWDLYYEKRKNQVNQNETDQIVLLNELSDEKIVTDREYARRRKQIEDEAALASAQSEVANAYLKVNATKAGTKERADAEANLADKQKGLTDRVKQNGDDTDDARLKKTLNTLGDIQTGYSNMVGATSEILSIGYNTQKANLEKLEAQQQKNFESDTTRISGSTLSEQEKSNQLIILDKQRQVQKEINDRKARQLDLEKARFEKAASIASIALSTAQAVMHFLYDPGGYPGLALSVSAGILGAAQIAAAVATPLPKYRHGTTDHPGGGAVVGDGFEKELIKEPGKQAYWSPAVPTTLSLRPHTQVMPLSRISEMISQGMFVNQSGILAPQQIDNTADLRDIRGAIGWLGGVVKESARANRVRIPRPGSIANDLAHAAFIRKNVLD